jgi:hypothetical protein
MLDEHRLIDQLRVWVDSQWRQAPGPSRGVGMELGMITAQLLILDELTSIHKLLIDQVRVDHQYNDQQTIDNALSKGG